MAMESRRSSDPEHDWLLVSSSRYASQQIMLRVSERSRQWLKTATAFLLNHYNRLDDILRDVLASSGRRAPILFQKIRKHQFRQQSLAALRQVDLARIGDQIRSGWRWMRARARHLRLHPIAVFLALVTMLPLGYLAYCVATLPSDGGLVIEPTPSALVVQADNGQIFATRGVFKGEKLSPQELPRNLIRAIIAIEDRYFYEHSGFYVPSLIRAAYRNFISGSAREGGSTITQQLARMTYLSQDRTVRRKVQEAILTVWLERRLSKEEILTRYLNTAYFGAGVYGVDAAAKRYFGKTAKDLSVSEAAMLAGLVRAPSALAPNRNLEGARQRAALVLDAMVATDAISREEAAAARQQPATLPVPPDNPPGTNYFVDMLAGEVKRLVGPVSADLTLRTTLDLNLQSIAEDVVARRLKAEGRSKKVGQAALVAMTLDGAILAVVGGRDYNESQFNRATQAKRQPGSLFKLFVYLAALEKGFNPQMTMVDRPIQIGDWEPNNYGGRFRGEVTLRSAFANSINSVAVQLADQIGVKTVIETARRLGIRSELPAVPSLALGSAEVTLMEMTRSFAALAANAENIEPHAIDSIQKADQVLFARPKSALTPATHQTARAGIRDLLASVVREGTGRAARISVPAAGKTGTTQENRDAWFIGFTSDIVVGVWVGNDDNSPTRNVTGGDIPARIWNEFVTQSILVRAKSARARPIVLAAPTPETTGSSPNAAAIRGAPVVQTTGTLEVQGRPIRLYGVDGIRGRAAREFRRYLGRREIACEPIGNGNEYRCRVDGQDLSRVVLFNGGGRAALSATPELRVLEQQARSARVGIWGGRYDDDGD